MIFSHGPWIPDVYNGVKTAVDGWIEKNIEPTDDWQDNQECPDTMEDFFSWLKDENLPHETNGYGINQPESLPQNVDQELLMCCNHRFSTNYNLNLHLKQQHGDGEFVCDVCSKRFKTKQNLSVHSQRIIPCQPITSVQFPCPSEECKRVYLSLKALKHHWTTSHK